jgi:hypothetical protein
MSSPDEQLDLPPGAPLPDSPPREEEPIVLPASTRGLLTVEEVRKAYESDETIAGWNAELASSKEEYDALAPNIRDLQSMLDRLKRQRSLLRHRNLSLTRRIRARKKYLIQRLFDKVLMDVRRKLGVTKKIKLDNFQ